LVIFLISRCKVTKKRVKIKKKTKISFYFSSESNFTKGESYEKSALPLGDIFSFL